MSSITESISVGTVPVQIPGLEPDTHAMPIGKIGLWYGSMYSGKTTEIWEQLQKIRLTGRPVLFVKFAGDSRYTTGARIKTHSGLEFGDEPESEFKGVQMVVLANKLADIIVPDGIMDIAVDEGQFFPDLASVVMGWSQIGGINVYIAGLLADKDQRHFGAKFESGRYIPGQIEQLLPFCRVHQLESVCRSCGGTAIHTVKIGGSDELVEIGGIELYHPVCETCLAKLKSSKIA